MISLPLATFLAGVGVGLTVAAPIGPMGLLCIQRTLALGLAAGLVVGLAAATVHAAYGVLAVVGLSATVTMVTDASAQILSLLSGMMLFWFAPPLAAWHDAGVAKALFFSFFGCLLNWRAFLAYGAVSALVLVALPLAVLSVLMMLSLKVAAMSLLFPLLLMLMPTLFASFYASYRDVFGIE